jgi:hypothetical protein
VVQQTVFAGAQFTLENGDVVSPAYLGWTDGLYTLIEWTPTVTKESQQALRQASYTLEADPLFFMAQRGEATMEEWQTKVAEIKARYPYPTEE